MTSTPLFFLTLLLLPSFFFPSLPLQKNSQEKGLKNTPKQEESPEEKAQRELEERRKRYQEQQKKDQELRKQEEERRRKNLEFLRQREAQEGKNSIIVPYTLDEAPFEWIQKALPDLLPKLEQTLKAGFKPNQRNSFDYSLLNYAIFCNSHEDPQALCEIRGNRYDEILLLLHYGADPQLQDSQHGNALHMAAKKGDINLTYLFLEKGVSVHSLNARQETPAFLTVPYGVEVLNILLHHGANPNAKNKEGRSLLRHLLTFGATRSFVEILLQHGADPTEEIEMLQREIQTYPSFSRSENLALMQQYQKRRGTLPLPPPFPPQILPPQTSPPLIQAVLQNNREAVKTLLAQGENPNAISALHQRPQPYENVALYGTTALSIALFKGYKEIAKLLVTAGADVNLRNPSKIELNLPLFQALPDEEMTRFLLENGADIHRRATLYDQTAILIAKDVKTIDLLLKYGANINDKGRYGNVLIQAVYEKNLELLQYLLEKGADVHLTNHENQTALFIAIAQGQPQMVKLLLEKGSDVSLKDSAGRTAYDFALLKKKDEIAAQILQYGGRIENPEELASEAIQRGNTALMARLLEQGLDVNARKDYPFLQQAVGNHQIEMIRLLIEKGADIRIQDTQQNTLLHSIFDPKLLEYLLQKGLNPNQKNQSKKVPLHDAARRGLVQKVQLLVKYGAQVHFEDDFHYTPLHYAAMGPVDYSSSDGSPPDWNETPQYLKIMEILIIAGADPYKSTGKFSQSPIEEAKKVQNPDFVKRALKILQR